MKENHLQNQEAKQALTQNKSSEGKSLQNQEAKQALTQNKFIILKILDRIKSLGIPP